jgi:aryl-alcohol dehydrogenase-like predicted oxidoreductase
VRAFCVQKERVSDVGDTTEIFAYSVAEEQALATIRALEDGPISFADTAALQFSLRDRRITSTIVGIRKPECLQETIELTQYLLPEDIWEEIADKERTSDACA